MLSEILLEFSRNSFSDKFVNEIAKNSLGIRGDDLPFYLKDEKLKNKNDSILFSKNTIYCVTITKDDKILLVGTQI